MSEFCKKKNSKFKYTSNINHYNNDIRSKSENYVLSITHDHVLVHKILSYISSHIAIGFVS